MEPFKSQGDGKQIPFGVEEELGQAQGGDTLPTLPTHPHPTPAPTEDRLKLAVQGGAGVTEAHNPWHLAKILTEAGG